MKGIIEASPVKAANMRILLTGHSLGGVVAILAAHDLATQLGPQEHPGLCFQASARSDVDCQVAAGCLCTVLFGVFGNKHTHRDFFRLS